MIHTKQATGSPAFWFCAITSVIAAAPALAETIIDDQFIGNAVDTQTWAASPYFPDSAVTESGGSLFLQNRGRLLSVQSMPQAIQIDGRFRFVGSAYDQFLLQTRTNGVTTNPWGEWDVGIRFGISPTNGENGGATITIVRNAWPGTSPELARGALPIATNTFYDFRIIDTGSLVQFFIGDLSAPYLSATETELIGDRFGLSNREGGGGGSWISNGSVVELDYLRVSSIPEIDPAGIGSVLALVTGAIGLLERRRVKTA